VTAGQRHDIHQSITDQIIAAIERGVGDFQMPWHRAAGSTMRPSNISTGLRYQGVNVLTLWIAAESCGFASPVWGTFKQWRDKGHPVRKGERATYGVIYKDLRLSVSDADTNAATDKTIALARAFALFNAEQVEGYTPPMEALLQPQAIETMDRVEQLFAASAARITEVGERAFYRPSTDEIMLPPRGAFHDTPTRPAAEAFYATALHELTHWSGAKHRLDRNLSGRFGSEAYAMEELIAELGSAYLCGDLGVSPIARADHAQYLASWLKVLKADKKAIFTAASMAQRAARYLHDMLDDAEADAAAPAPVRPPDLDGLPLFGGLNKTGPR
jgi:antirestriction protein ArdC